MIHGFTGKLKRKTQKTTIGKKLTGLINQQDGARVYFKICTNTYNTRPTGWISDARCMCVLPFQKGGGGEFKIGNF